MQTAMHACIAACTASGCSAGFLPTLSHRRLSAQHGRGIHACMHVYTYMIMPRGHVTGATGGGGLT